MNILDKGIRNVKNSQKPLCGNLPVVTDEEPQSWIYQRTILEHGTGAFQQLQRIYKPLSTSQFVLFLHPERHESVDVAVCLFFNFVTGTNLVCHVFYCLDFALGHSHVLYM